MVDTIEHGTIASVHYTGTFAEGGEFDSSRGKDPLVFIVGYGADDYWIRERDARG